MSIITFFIPALPFCFIRSVSDAPCRVYFCRCSIDNIYVFDDGILNGIIHWNFESSERWELKELYVDPFFQGEGIGTSLIKNFIESAKRRNAYETFLWVLEENPSAISFYERQEYMNTLTVLPIHTLASQ